MTGVPTSSDAELHILFVTQDQFPPFRPAAKMIYGEELPRRGHRVDWLLQATSAEVSSGPQPFGNGVAYVAPTDMGTSRWRRVRKHWLDFKNDLAMFGLLRRGRYSAVQVKDEYLAALLAIVACRLYGVPLFYWLAYPHSEASIYAAEHGIARYRWFYWLRGVLQGWLLYRLIMPAAAHVFVQSERMREDIAKRGIPREKMTPVPSTVNVAELKRTEAAVAEKPPGERWIVYLGTLMRERQLDIAIRALPRVLERAPDARLVLVGAGENPEDEAHLVAEAERLGVAQAVHITGWLPMQDAWAHVRAADVCVSPIPPVPIYECGSPTKLVEYMALGKAVVANEHSEQTPVLEQSGAGVLCDWSADGFADAVLEVLADPERARAMGVAGRRYVEEHRTHARMADVVEAVYRSKLAGAPLALAGARQ